MLAARAVETAIEAAEEAANEKFALVVEDDPLIRMTTSDIVADLGFTVIESPSAENALEILASQHVDMLVTDVGLGGISGLELAWAVRRDYPAIGIVVATGHSVASEDLAPGAVVLSKPFDDNRIRDALERAGSLVPRDTGN